MFKSQLRLCHPCSSRLLKNYSQSTALYGTRRYARRRSAAESYVQLLVARDARSQRSSAARHSSDGGRSPHSTLPAVRRDLRPRGPTVDCAREIVASAVAADVVLDPQRALADGRDGLQPVVPLVC